MDSCSKERVSAETLNLTVNQDGGATAGDRGTGERERYLHVCLADLGNL